MTCYKKCYIQCFFALSLATLNIVLTYGFSQEMSPKSLKQLVSRSMKFMHSTFSLITIAITRSPFSCSDSMQNFSWSKEHFQNLKVRCDWCT